MSDKGEPKEFIFDLLGYNPSVEQWWIHQDEHRQRLVAGGERSGKSFLGVNDLFGSMYGMELIWLFGADYSETSQEYLYCIDAAAKLGILKFASKNYNPGEIILSTGTIIRTVSGTDITKIGREAPDFILVCEAAKIDYEAYLRLNARLAQKRGDLLMTGTFEGSVGWYPQMYALGQTPNEDIKSFSLPTWTNLAVFPQGREDPEILRQERLLPSDLFQERFAGVPCPPAGLVFDEFRINHHVREIEPDGAVYLAVDPGYAGAYAVEAVQITGDRVEAIDEVYEQGLTTQQVIKICQMRPWWSRVEGGAIDIAARQHQAMPAVAEVWLKEAEIHLRSRKVRIVEGIERMRTFLKINPLTNQPNIFFDPRCKGIISEFGGGPNPFTGQQAVYRYRMGRESEIVSEEPEDKNNHGIKAMIYFLVDRFGFAHGARKERVAKVTTLR